MSVPSSVKLFVVVSAVGLFFYVMIEHSVELPQTVSNNLDIPKYILDWRVRLYNHYLYTGQKRHVAFKQNYCPRYPNCFLTEDHDLLPDLTDYDAVLFHGSFLAYLGVHRLPPERSPRQKYIFVTVESAHNYPVCDPHYNGYFNWTWTYRLDSDLRWGFLTVYDLDGNEIGPKTDMNWLPTDQPINDDLRRKLKTKRKTAAWFVSNCETSSQREKFVQQLLKELRQYRMTIDIFGRCSPSLKCPKQHFYCNQMIEQFYYFYLSFENSFDVDYVSEKLLNAVENLAVPVVYGSANYSRFLPPGSYLDGRELGAKLLAKTMRDIIKNRTRYEDMFRWRNYYQIKQPFMSDVCDLCAKLYDAEEMARETVWENFHDWWNTGPSWCNNWNNKHRKGSMITE